MPLILWPIGAAVVGYSYSKYETYFLENSGAKIVFLGLAAFGGYTIWKKLK